MNSDKRIIELQKQITLKHEELGDKPKLDLVTNGLLKMGDGSTVNLNTVPEDIAISLLVDLNSRRISASDLGIPYPIGGFLVESWIEDIQARLVHLEYHQEYRRLEYLESKLERLLSEEKKKERAVETIADEI